MPSERGRGSGCRVTHSNVATLGGRADDDVAERLQTNVEVDEEESEEEDEEGENGGDAGAEGKR